MRGVIRMQDSVSLRGLDHHQGTKGDYVCFITLEGCTCDLSLTQLIRDTVFFVNAALCTYSRWFCVHLVPF